MRTERCYYCQFYERGQMECRFNPPTVAFDPEGKYGNWSSAWPRVQDADWCGKFVLGKDFDRDPVD